MPRKLRVQYEGAIYHVMNRGDRREPIYLDDEDRELFLETLANRLRAETTMTWKWIAERLAMGHWRTARNAARKLQIKGTEPKRKILH